MKHIAAVTALLLGACAAEEEPPPVPAGAHRTYALSQQLVPVNEDTATATALDIDGDGQVENRLGHALPYLPGPDTAPNDVIAGLIASGDEHMTVDVQTDAWTSGTGAGFTTAIGADASTGVLVGRVLDNRTLLSDAGDIDIVAPFGVLGTATTLRLHHARVRVQEQSNLRIEGILAGGVQRSDIDAQLLPQLLPVFQAQVAADCGTDGTPPFCGCPQTTTTTGKTFIAMFDGDIPGSTPDCHISLDEVLQNQFVTSLLAPDLADDQISFGFEFEATATGS